MMLLSIEFLLVYVVITVLVWTIGNNDPIYTRFLYPSYVYMILLQKRSDKMVQNLIEEG